MSRLLTFAREHFYPLVLGLIFLVALGLRLWHLGTLPRSVTVDEANFGYIAYSLLKTGRDEHGVRLPLVFQAFGDQKLPLQAYLTVPSVAMLGLNNFATRLPSALLGSLSVLLIYALARAGGQSKPTGLILASLWALSPATFILSRFAYESNVGLTFFLLGLWGLGDLILAPKKRPGWSKARLVLGFTGAWYSYIAFRPVVVGLLVFSGLTVFWRQKKYWRSLLVSGAIFALLIAPSLLLTTGSNLARFQQIGLFNDQGAIMRVHENRNFCLSHGGNFIVCYAYYNKFWEWGKSLITNYGQAYSLARLFLSGDGEDYLSVASFGYFSFILGLGVVLGGVALVRKKASPAPLWWWLLGFGLLLSPLPAALAQVQKVRLAPFFPFIFLLAGVGFDYLLALRPWLGQHKKAARWVGGFLVGLAVLESSQFFLTFFTVHPFKNDMQYASVAESVSHFLGQVRQNEEPVYFSVNYPDPLMFYAYYTALDPSLYQQAATLAEREDSGFQHTKAVGTLYVLDENLTRVLELNSPLKDGYFVATNPQHLTEGQTGGDPRSYALAFDARSDSGAMEYAWVIDLNLYYQASVSATYTSV